MNSLRHNSFLRNKYKMQEKQNVQSFVAAQERRIDAVPPPKFTEPREILPYKPKPVQKKTEDAPVTKTTRQRQNIPAEPENNSETTIIVQESMKQFDEVLPIAMRKGVRETKPNPKYKDCCQVIPTSRETGHIPLKNLQHATDCNENDRNYVPLRQQQNNAEATRLI